MVKFAGKVKQSGVGLPHWAKWLNAEIGLEHWRTDKKKLLSIIDKRQVGIGIWKLEFGTILARSGPLYN